MTDPQASSGPSLAAVRPRPERRPEPVRTSHGVAVGIAVTALIVVALVALGAGSTYFAQQRNDQYQLTLLGECVRDGGRMYVDCWENKPPGLAWLTALAVTLSRGAQFGAWLLPGVLLLLALAAVGWVVHRLVGTFAACGCVLLGAVVFTLRLYDTPSINPDCYSAVVELVAGALLLLAAVRMAERMDHGSADAPDEGDPDLDCTATPVISKEPQTVATGPTGSRSLFAPMVLSFVAGVLWAMAATVKHTGAVGLLSFTLVGVTAHVRKTEQRIAWTRALVPAWIGLVLGLAGVISVLIARGNLGEAWSAVVTFNRGLTAWENVCVALGTWSRAVDGLRPVQLGLWLALVGLVGVWRTRCATVMSPKSPRVIVQRAEPQASAFAVPRGATPLQTCAWSTSVMAALVIWWGGQVALALIGPSQSMRYWQATFPPMLLLAAVGLHFIGVAYRRLPARLRSPLVIGIVTAVGLLGLPLFDHYSTGMASSYLAYSDGDVERQRLRAIGDVVREHVPPGERIYVLAYDAGVYVYADRLPASRFTYPRSEEQMAEILADIEGGKASAILLPEKLSSQFERWCDEGCSKNLRSILDQSREQVTLPQYDLYVVGELTSFDSE